MRLYAVVGGIAAGKSTVVRRMARRYGGTWIDADRLGHQVLELAPVRQRLLDAFGPDIVGRRGSIDRRRLGARVFGHPARLRRLNAIVHPEIARRVRARLEALARRKERWVLLDAALFFEFDLGWPVDGVLAVVAPRRLRRARLLRRSGVTLAAANARLASQPQLAAWIRRADVRLDNDCALQELDGRIQDAWRELRRLPRPRRGRK
jgi:dephospho-CoA kinase